MKLTRARDFLLTKLEAVDLAEGKPIEILVPGTFIDMYGRRIQFEAEDFEAYVENTQAAIGQTIDSEGEPVGLAIDSRGHEDVEGAAGWIVGVSLDAKADGTPVIMGEVRWTDIGVDLIERKVRRFFSGEFDMRRKIIHGGSLTNHPATRDIETGAPLLAPVELAMMEAYGGRLYRLQEDDESLDEQTRKVRNAWYEASETMEGPDSWVMEVFDDHVIVEMGEFYFQIPYEDTEEGVVFAERDEWTQVEHAWVEVAMSAMRAAFRAALERVRRLAGTDPDPERSRSGDLSDPANPEQNADPDPDQEDEAMELDLSKLSEEDRAALVRMTAEELGLSVTDLEAAKNGDKPGELLAQLVDRRADEKVKAQLAEAKRRDEIVQFAERVTGGDEETPRGLPIQDERIVKFLSQLKDEDLRAEAQAIFLEIHEKGVTPFDEAGHQREIEGGTSLEDWAADQLRTFLSEDPEATVAEFFALNQAELGKMSDYDLSEFKEQEKAKLAEA